MVSRSGTLPETRASGSPSNPSRTSRNREAHLAEDGHQRDQRQARDGAVVIALDLIEQDDPPRFELVAARTIDRPVRVYVTLDRVARSGRIRSRVISV